MQRRFTTAALLLGACAAAAYCTAERPPGETTGVEQRDARALALVRAAVARDDSTRTGGTAPRFVPEKVQFRSTASEAVPAMTYWWGAYAPPGTADLWIEHVAARGPTEARLLTTPEDWIAAARAAGWRPTSAAAAMAGCVEAVRAAGPRGGPLSEAQFYRDSFAVSNGDLAIYPESARAFAFKRRLEEAQATGDTARGFTAAFWMLEPGQTTRYRCVVSPTSFRLTAVDSLREMGLVPLP